MLRLAHPRLALLTAVTGALLIAIFAGITYTYRFELRNNIHDTVINRDAAVLSAVAEAQLREAESDPGNRSFVAEMLLPSLLKTVEGMRGVVIYDAEGNILQTSPTTLARAELPPDDSARLATGDTISRYTPDFPLERYFTDERAQPGSHREPILEVALPLHSAESSQPVGFVRYFIGAQRLAAELDAIDRRLGHQAMRTLLIGSGLIVLVLLGAYVALARAQRIIAERNERLTRANFELTLAAKTSAVGVITSHLIHGLQGPIAGLRAVVADRASGEGSAEAEWQSAAGYADRMQSMVHETVALLGDTANQATYELTMEELADTIRQRNQASAIAKGVVLEVHAGKAPTIDSHRGSLVCLIATNLVQNAIEATDPGRHVAVHLGITPAAFVVTVTDQGAGIPTSIRDHLFEPGRTGRPGGTGLGLTISQLLARQIGATLELVQSSAEGTAFRLSVPLG